jgi:malate dehydrogenase (oxaloacetate-decarboxylating)(NADP+)
MACANLYILLGVTPANITMFDKMVFLQKTEQIYLLQQKYAVGKTDYIGRSHKNDTFRPEMFFPLKMLLTMADNPIVFCNGNPVPEIDYH